MWLSLVAKAVAKIGAKVDTEPSINPANPGWTQVKINCFLAFFNSSIAREDFSIMDAFNKALSLCLLSISAKSPRSFRISGSAVFCAVLK